MFSIIVLYIIIIIIQVLYTINVPIYLNEKEKIQNEIIAYNNKNKDKLQKIFTEKINTMANKINNSDLNFQDTIDKYYKTASNFSIDNHEYYVTIMKQIKNSNKIVETTNYIYIMNQNDIDKNMVAADVIRDKKEDVTNRKYTISENLYKDMYNLSKVNEISNSKYYWITNYTNISVQKLAYYTRVENKYNETGIILIGYDIDNLSDKTKFKYSDYIYKPELVFASLLSITISLLISHFSKSNIKAITVLLIINIYILYFINTTENKSTKADENYKSDQINNSILSLTFLTGVNTYIIQEIYKKNRKLFIETSFIFAVSIILLLIACYKATYRNDIFNIIGSRITNQLVFNLCIILNAIIIINFTIHAFKSWK